MEPQIPFYLPLNGQPQAPPHHPVFFDGQKTERPRKVHRENVALKLQNSWFWTQAPEMQSLQKDVFLAATRNVHTLIIGESGTGKEVVASEIAHIRRGIKSLTLMEAPFVALNCSCIPENLAESILFGHERGAFTSARERRLGKFEQANSGTLFLDEIQNMPLEIQAKLLRVVQQGEIDRLGSNKTKKFEAQIVTASNIALELLVDKGKFRRDLYYRLNGFPIFIPPLRARIDDIPHLAKHFLQLIQKKHTTLAEDFSPEVLEKFMNYPWPGNIRELEHCVLFGSLKTQGPLIGLEDLPPLINGTMSRWIRDFQHPPSLSGINF